MTKETKEAMHLQETGLGFPGWQGERDTNEPTGFPGWDGNCLHDVKTNALDIRRSDTTVPGYRGRLPLNHATVHASPRDSPQEAPRNRPPSRNGLGARTPTNKGERDEQRRQSDMAMLRRGKGRDSPVDEADP
jgi:hypothetical protein